MFIKQRQTAILFLQLLLVVVLMSNARPAFSELTIANLPSLVEFNFDGVQIQSGIASTEIEFCIKSTPLENPPLFFTGPGEYAVKAASSSGSFTLQKNGKSIPFEVLFNRTPTNSAAFELLQYDTYDTKYSEALNCEAVSLRVSIAESDIQQAPAGTYTNTLTFSALNYAFLFGFIELPRDEASITIAFTIPKQVKISGLEDLTLTGDDTLLSAEDPDGFCVFATWGSLYSITATSLEGSFELRDGTTIPTLPYDVLIKDSASSTWSSALVYGVQAPGDRFGDDDQSCSTGNNMDLRIEANPAGVNAGTYTGTLYLTVRPI